MELLYYETAVPAGFPSPALDYMEERIDLSRELISHPLSTFIVECTGDSMMGAFIPPRARLLVGPFADAGEWQYCRGCSQRRVYGEVPPKK